MIEQPADVVFARRPIEGAGHDPLDEIIPELVFGARIAGAIEHGRITGEDCAAVGPFGQRNPSAESEASLQVHIRPPFRTRS